MRRVFNDDFDRADSSTVGNGWTPDAGAYSISSNAITYVSGGWIFAPNPLAVGAQYMVLTGVAGSEVIEVGLWVDQSTDNGYFWQYTTAGLDGYRLYRRVEGANTEIYSAGSAGDPRGSSMGIRYTQTNVVGIANGLDPWVGANIADATFAGVALYPGFRLYALPSTGSAAAFASSSS